MQKTIKNNKLDTNLTSFTKINSKWITDLSDKTIKLLEDKNTGINLGNLRLGGKLRI